MKRREEAPWVLTVAGSDSGGGAGIQGDLKTFAALGVRGVSAVTAVTAQNRRGIVAIQEVPAEIVVAQIEAVVGDGGVQAAKTGMLGSRRTVEAVAASVERLQIPNLVVDPVMVSKGGVELLAGDAVETLRRLLFPLARVVTPNLPEAEILTGRKLDRRAALKVAAREIREMGPSCVVIKGGHAAGEPADLFFDGKSFVEFGGERLQTASDHGTGCAFSAAIAAHLARGAAAAVAVGEAKRYVWEALKAARPLGPGHGPIEHLYRFRWRE